LDSDVSMPTPAAKSQVVEKDESVSSSAPEDHMALLGARVHFINLNRD
jgi:hypothetical protein